MAHHSSEPFDDDAARALRDVFPATPPLGATGQFPQGKYTPQDEGEIQFGVAADKQNRKVLINFGKPVAWMGMDADQADDLADLLKRKAAEIRG